MSLISSALDLCPDEESGWSRSSVGSTEPSAQFRSPPGDKNKVEVNNLIKEERRLRLSKWLEDKGHDLEFRDLTEKLGLKAEYKDNYKESAINLFRNVANRAPCIIEKRLERAFYIGDDGPVNSYDSGNSGQPEKCLVTYFKWMYEKMEEVAGNSVVRTTGGPNSADIPATTFTASTASVNDNGPVTRSKSAALHQRASKSNPECEATPAVQPARQNSRDNPASFIDEPPNLDGFAISRKPASASGTTRGSRQNTGADVLACPSPTNIPSSKYRFDDHQNRPVDGSTKLRPDGAFRPREFVSFCLKTIHVVFEAKVKLQHGRVSGIVLGQIGDYVREVWEKQISRTFVPVVYIAGGYAWVLIFTPGEWHQCKLGPICHDKENVGKDDAEKVAQTLAQLWFILTLPEKDFGHFCPMAEKQRAMKFTHKLKSNSDDSSDASEPPEDVFTEAEFVSGGDGSFKLGKPIHPKVSACGGRMSHIFRDNKYYCKDGQTRPAILKLSWTPVKRLPEGLIYEYLHGTRDEKLTDYIPKVYDSGIVSENVFDYRVEYIIMEDCGQTAKEYVLKQAENGVIVETVYEDLLGWLKDAISIIGYACVHSAFHRDISTGNLLIGKKGLKVADWGLAKIKKEVLIELKDLAKKWLLTNVEEVAQNEEHHDKLTGTPLYTGIRVMAGARKRGLIDDIESIWYAILHLWSLYNKGVINTSNTMAYMLCQSKPFAGLRAGCVSDQAAYMHSFGAEGMPKGDLYEFLNLMYMILFVDSDGPMGIRMALVPGNYPRLHNSLNLKWLFGDDLSQKLSKINLGDSSPSAVNRRIEPRFSSKTQHGGSTHVEVTERVQQRTDASAPSYRILPNHNIPVPLFQGMRMLSTISEEPEMQEEDGEYVEGEKSAFPQAANRQRQQLTQRQGSGNSQGASEPLVKRKDTGTSGSSRKKTRSE